MTDKTESSTKNEVKPVDKSAEPTHANKSELDRVLGLMETLVKTIDEKSKADATRFSQIEESIKSLNEKPKAMETPTNLPAKPKVEAEEDIGDQTKAPKDWYQSHSHQAGIREASPLPNSTDKPDLKMEEKAEPVNKAVSVTHTETPRPQGIAGVLNKAREAGYEMNPILKEFRELGFEFGSQEIARRIRKGTYHNEPTAWTPLGI